MSDFSWGDYEDEDIRLTAVHRQYVGAFEDWLRADDTERPKHERRRRNLMDLMKLDKPRQAPGG